MNKSEAKAYAWLLMAIYGPSSVSMMEGAVPSEWGIRVVMDWAQERACTLWSRYDVIDAVRNAPEERVRW